MGCVQSKPCCRCCCACRQCCCRYSPSSDGDPGDRASSPRGADTRHAHVFTGSLVGTADVPSHALRLHYSSLSQRGHYPDSPDRQNQDSLLVLTRLQSCPDLHSFAVFDGHGQFGAECAAFARDNLAEVLSSDPLFLRDPAEAFAAAFVATNEALHAGSIDDAMSGTTAITVLVSGDTLFVANVGDSRAVVGVWDGHAGRVVARDLSCDQTPFRRDEYERVRRCGARVLSVDQVEGIKDPEVQSWGDEENDDGDPPRLWVQDGMYPGTAFTRSVGDSMAESIGVIAVPEIMTVKITPDHRFFVVASDGVFEFLSSQTVVDMVSKSMDPRDACSEIAAESYRIWLEHENRTDDITIIIVHIKNLGNSDVDGSSQASTKSGSLISENKRDERQACHQARRNVSKLQSCFFDVLVERCSACVAPSPTDPVLRNVNKPD